MDTQAAMQASAGATDRDSLIAKYKSVRAFTAKLCEPLSTEDYIVQPMEDASPPKWHLAHTTWFFETFILKPHREGYKDCNPAYAFLFNSYYVQAGERHARNQRGMITRPGVEETYEYRRHVDGALLELLAEADDALLKKLRTLMHIGLNHEQQHQELLITDFQYALSLNPLNPEYLPPADLPIGIKTDIEWLRFDGGIVQIGADADAEFAYDNEYPRHDALLQNYELASRPVTNGEYIEFIEDGGYEKAEMWLSDGAATVAANAWKAPLYWQKKGGEWHGFGAHGLRPLDLHAPVCHLSYYEADAYARWAGHRLPTEFEWEHAARTVPIEGNFVDSGHITPIGAHEQGSGLQKMYGDVWEWTMSPYSPYPGYRPAQGAIGEYNGKFMSNQYVLRGGSCATSQSHIRRSYRNFFHADKRWQFSGLRLARDV